MFEQSFVASGSTGHRAGSLAFSLALQSLALAVGLALPLVFTYKLPLQDLVRAMALAAPPPPPAPPAPEVRRMAAKPSPRRFEDVLTQPKSIPDHVALVDEQVVAALAAPALDGIDGGVLGGMPLLSSSLTLPLPPKPIVVGGRVQAARLLEKIAPSYPSEALEENISGSVTLRAVIGKDGTIRDLELLEGHPLLAPAAIEAVRQWRYRPTQLNGRAVEVVTEVAVNFRLVAPPEEEEKKAKKRRAKTEASTR